MTSEQLQNAQIIISVGTSLGANFKQLLAAIEAGLVESGLRNLNYGDRDSLGVFQQRPSQGWGSASQVRDVYAAANSFFAGIGTNPGVFSVSQSGTAGQMAQRVQRSAFPGRYDEREREARSILAQLGISEGATPTSVQPAITTTADGYYYSDFFEDPAVATAPGTDWFAQPDAGALGIGTAVAIGAGVLLLALILDL